MRWIIAVVLLFAAPVAAAEPITIKWQNPTESVGGEPVEPLAKFVLYRRVEDRWDFVSEVNYNGNPVTEAVFDLPCGTSIVAARVVTKAGIQSWLSNRVDKIVSCQTDPLKPKPPFIEE